MIYSFPALLAIVIAMDIHCMTPRKAPLSMILGRRLTWDTKMVLVLRARYTPMMSLLPVIRSAWAIYSCFQATNIFFPRLRTRHLVRLLVTRLAIPTLDGNQTGCSVWVSQAFRARELHLSSTLLSLRVFYLPIPSGSAQQSYLSVELTANFIRVILPMYQSPKR